MQEPRQPLLLQEQNTLLAAERTYSAWVRTGLACVGGGLAVGKGFAASQPLARLLALGAGLLLIVTGVLIFAWATRDYLQVCARLRHAQFKTPLRGFMLLITALLLVAAALSAAILLL